MRSPAWITVACARRWLTLERWRRERQGAIAVEFALIAPLFLLVVLVFFELAIALIINGSLQSAVTRAARLGATGAETVGMSRIDLITAAIEARTFGIADAEALEIEILVYPSFAAMGTGEDFIDQNGNGVFDNGEAFTDGNGNGEWDEDIGEAGPGGPGDVVLYTVSYRGRILSTLLQPFVGDFALQTAVAVRNEAF